jgi:hypothetical protein
MKIYIKTYFPKIFGMLKIFRSLFLNGESYLYKSGYYRSAVEGRPCDRDGNEIPWMNYSFIDILNKTLNKDLSLFEYGSGSSTLYFSKYVNRVVSCEHDVEWYKKVKSSAPDNVRCIFKEHDINGKYCRAITEQNDFFDVVIVDGCDRANCVKQSVEKLTEFKCLKDRGYRALTITGLKPLMKKAHSTTIFYRDGNCLDL